MCRNLGNRIKAIEEAKRTTPNIVEVYDSYDDGIDLVSIVEILDKSTARIMEVNRLGELELFKVVRFWNDPSNRQIASLCGMDSRFTRIVRHAV